MWGIVVYFDEIFQKVKISFLIAHEFWKHKFLLPLIADLLPFNYGLIAKLISILWLLITQLNSVLIIRVLSSI